MREALAHTNRDLRSPRRPPRGSAKPHALTGAGHLAAGALRQFRIRPATTIAGAAFAALMTGIALNALVMQKPRHLAPIGDILHRGTVAPVAPRPSAVAVAPAPPRSAPASPAPTGPANAPAADPIAHLLKNGGASQPTEAPRKPAATGTGDPIGRLLKSTSTEGGDPVAALLKREAPSGASEKTILAAQHALLKLGYVVKPDGAFQKTTHRALEHFEKEHHLPVGDRLTPQLMQALAAAVAALQE